MIYVIDRTNRANYIDQIEQMYRIRHAIYVTGRGWKALERPDGREIDQFDTDDAVYLLGMDNAGKVTAGLRLIPTTKPHLMRDVFPHTVTRPGGVPHSPRVYEWTRYFLKMNFHDRYERRMHSGELLCAMLEYAMEMRLTHISVVSDTFFLPMMREAGWAIEELGEPTPYDEGTCIALLIEVSGRALASTQKARAIPDYVLSRRMYPPGHRENAIDRAA